MLVKHLQEYTGLFSFAPPTWIALEAEDEDAEDEGWGVGGVGLNYTTKWWHLVVLVENVDDENVAAAFTVNKVHVNRLAPSHHPTPFTQIKTCKNVVYIHSVKD